MFDKRKIVVTAKHIEKGIRADGDYCPIAYALREAGFCHVSVDNTSFFETRAGYRLRARLPKKAQKFMARFDGGKKVQPFSFVLEPKLD